MIQQLWTACKQGMEIEDTIRTYFNQGFSNPEILGLLVSVHNYTIGMRTLKRWLKRMGLKRAKWNSESPLEEIVGAIFQEIEGSVGSFSGYRDMLMRLRVKHKLSVRRDTVMVAMREIDPEGVSLRRRHRLKRRRYTTPGPNFLWHIDGWDKLKPYGFCVHGCTDGFSRKILWLEVASTNKNPAVCLTFFLETVSQLKGVPKMVRMDKGTENVLMADIQTLLRMLNSDAANETCVIMGKSSANQRIEAYWSKLRRGGGGWWMNYFKDLRDSGIFDDTDPVQCECLRFCFMPVLRKELAQIAQMWNTKNIHVGKNSELNGGKPDIMFLLPEAYGAKNNLVSVNEEEVVNCKQIYAQQAPDYSPEFAEIIQLLNISMEAPADTQQALDKFKRITQLLKHV